MGITKNNDVKDAFRIITEDGNRIFLQDINDYDMRDVKLKESTETGTWNLVGIDDEPIITNMHIAYYAVSNKILSFVYRLLNESKEERKTIKLWF
jgi:hypothetical protein